MQIPIRPRRSALFLPASNPRAIEKARTLPVDMVILDLEDAVAAEAKEAARAAAVAAANDDGFGGRELVVRVNPLDTPWGQADLAAVVGAPFNAVLVPKVSHAHEVARVNAALMPAVPETALWAMIETPRAIAGLQAIADMARTTRLGGLILGTNDLALEMHMPDRVDRAGLVPILSHTVVAARAAGIPVLDGVCNDFTDQARFDAECAQARMLGFDGKALIHPAQIEACNAAFAPDDREVAHARAVVAAFDDPANAGRGAVRVDGTMAERLHLLGARRVLAAADRDG